MLYLLLATFSVLGSFPCATALATPNVIVLISDDAGWADFGFMDSITGATTPIPTPNLDALAARGVKFSSAYTAMVCSPSRAAITTGGYQQRQGYEYNINNLTSATGPFEGLPVEANTIWERMKSVGYTTGAVGKWHIGSIADASPTEPGNRPQNQGVDEFYGMWRGSRVYNVGGQTNTRALRETIVDEFGNVTDTVVEGDLAGQYITETFGDYAVQFISDHHDDTDPFFLYQAFTAPHGPLNNSPDFNDPRLSGLSGNRKQYASMMLTMDDEIGRILDRLDDPDGNGNNSDSITDDTLVMFINDNGGASSNASDNGPLRNFKGTPWEGGIRVPMIIAGAGVDPNVHGSTYDAPVHSIDILPTAFAAGGGSFGPSDTDIDGVNLLPYINGHVTSDPHEVIAVRSADQVGVRKGDWKLVKNGTNSNFQLFDLSTDIGESNNLAGSNAAKVEELQRDLTEVESEFDKPRFAQLNSNQNTVNIFDHFTLRVEDGKQPGANILNNPGFENGTQLDGDASYTFEELADWSNNGDNTSPAQDEVAARNDSAFEGSYRSVVSGDRTHYQLTDHVISFGEEFSIRLASSAFSGWTVGTDTINMELFYLSSSGTMVVLDTVVLSPGSDWSTSTHTFSPIVFSGALGKQLGIRFDTPATDSAFASLDSIELGLSTTGGVQQVNFSDSNAWVEGGTTNVETMFHTDAFAGAVLEFPTTEDFSYVANNDMTRSTGLEYMLNKVILSGSYTGSSNESATIEGNDLLFTDSLDGAGPMISAEASNSSAPEFSYAIDVNVIMFDDLELTGNGDAEVTINGVISEYSEPSSLTKSGSSKFTLNGANNYTGDTTVEAGTLSVTNAFLADAADVYLSTGAIFDLDYAGTDTIDALFIDGVSQQTGTWGAVGSGATHQSNLFTGNGLLLVSTFVGLAGDFNGDGRVDAQDFLEWQRNPTIGSLSDWEANYGTPVGSNSATVPEPSSALLLLVTLCGLAGQRWRG